MFVQSSATPSWSSALSQAFAGKARALMSLAALSVALSSVVACAPPVRVKTAQDPQADLESYTTFAMMEPNRAVPTDNTKVDPFVLQRLRQLTYARMKEIGLKPVDKDQAELLVGVAASSDERVDAYPTRMYGYDPIYGYNGWDSQVSVTEEGTVVIDLVDSKKNAVVWRGTGVRATAPRLDDEKLKQTVDTILDSFRPVYVQEPVRE